jgi:DNA polymerase III delta prime subunit
MTTNTRLTGAEIPTQIPSDIQSDIARQVERKLTAEEAATHQEAEFERVIQTVLAWLEADKDSRGAAPEVLFRYPAGTGKTTTALQKAAWILERFPNLRIVLLVDSLKRMMERRKDALEMGIANVRLQLGRSQPNPDADGERMCAKWELAELVAAKGDNISSTLCKGKDADGNPVECQFAATCAYLRQQAEGKKGGLLIAAHQYNALPLDSLKDVDLTIIDETFTQSMKAHREVNIERFTLARQTGENHRRKKGESPASYEMRRLEDDVDLAAFIGKARAIQRRAEDERRQWMLSEFRAAGFTAEICDRLVGLEYTRFDNLKIHPGMDIAEQLSGIEKAQLQEASGFARVWRILGTNLATSRQGRPHGLALKYNVKNEKTGELRNVIKCAWSRDPILSGIPTIMLDGNAGERATRRFYPNTEIKRMAVEWRNVRTTFVSDKTASRKMFAQTARRTSEIANFVRSMAYRVWPRTGGDPRKLPALIGYKNTIEQLANDNLPCIPGYLGNLRGTNDYQHCLALIMFGRNEPSVEDLEEYAEAVYVGDEEELIRIQPNEKGELHYPRRIVTVRAKNGDTREIAVSYHPDPRTNELLEMIREGEQEQAAARGRFVHRPAENACELVVMSNIPCEGIEIDRFADWAEVVPDRFDIMALNGIVPEKSQDVADFYKELFPSAAAVRRAWADRPERAFDPAGGDCEGTVLIGNNTETSQRAATVRVSFERPGENGKVRAGAFQVRLIGGDTPKTVLERVEAACKERKFDAYDFDVAMIEQAADLAPAAEVQEAPATGQKQPSERAQPPRPRYSPQGFRYVSRAALLLAYATAPADDRAFWLEPQTGPKKSSTVARMQNPANANDITSTFEASRRGAIL